MTNTPERGMVSVTTFKKFLNYGVHCITKIWEMCCTKLSVKHDKSSPKWMKSRDLLGALVISLEQVKLLFLNLYIGRT